MPPVFRPLYPKKPNRARVDFVPREFRAAIFTKGMRVLWEQAARCPCETIYDDGVTSHGVGEFRSDCPGCYGRGVIYHSALETWVLFEDATTNPDRFAVYGENASGMAGITFLPENVPGFLDRVTMLDNHMVYNETRVRRATTEQLRWPVVTRAIPVGTESDATEPETLEVAAVYCRKADSTGVLDPTVLNADTDFEVDTDGKIDWSIGDVAGTAPLTDQRYTVQYFGHPVYIVRDFPFNIRDTWIKRKNPTQALHHLPIKSTAWLNYLGPVEWPAEVG